MKRLIVFLVMLFALSLGLHSQQAQPSTSLKEQALEQLTILDQQILDLKLNLQQAEGSLATANELLAQQSLQVQSLEQSLKLSQTIYRNQRIIITGLIVVVVIEGIVIIVR